MSNHQISVISLSTQEKRTSDVCRVHKEQKC
jgi:hypothetical protein